MTKDILDLQKELKRVNFWRDVYKKEIHKYLDTQMYLAKQCDELVEELETAKADAYKEFAEKLDKEFKDGDNALHFEWLIRYKTKKLLKELVGDK